MAGLEDGLFSFFANAPAGAPTSYPAMEARRKIALAVMANSGRKGFPKTLGEGLTAIGDAIGERGIMNQLTAQEAAYQKQAMAAAGEAVPGEARTAAPAPAPAAPTSYAPAAATDENTPSPKNVADENAPGGENVGGPYNFIDAQAVRGFKPMPGYLQDAITSREPNPEMQAYFGGLSAKEAPKGAGDVSPTGAAGPYQFTRGTAAQYGIPGAARMDPGASTDAVRALTADNAAAFQRINGRPPSYAELALMHQQGGTTGARMVAGTGNAPPGNLAVNNIPPGASAADAAAQVGRFYGMPNTPAPVSSRAAIAAQLAQRNAGPAQAVPQPNPTPAGAPAPSAMPSPSASAAAPGGPDSSALAFAGLPPEISQGASRPRPAQPPLPAMAQGIQPAPPDGLPPGPPAVPTAPLTGLPQRPVPPPVQVGPPPARVPLPSDVPMSEDEKRGYQLRAKALALGDPFMTKQAEGIIAYGAGQRKQQYDAILKDYQDQATARRVKELADEAFTRGAPERELARQKAELDLAKGKAFGGLSEEAVLQPVQKSIDQVKTIPAAQQAIQNALRVAPQMFQGAGADTQLAVAKILETAGFPRNPKIAPTEEFKSFIAPVLSAARQALVGGANISDNDMKLARQAVGGEITLDAKTIPDVLKSLERMNTAMAIQHQQKVSTASGDDPQRQAAMQGLYGLPMENVVPREAIALLRSNPTPEMAMHFDNKYHTPGLARRILGGQ